MNWNKLSEVYEAARRAGVSYSMNYEECEDSWFFSVRSIAPSEEWTGKNHSFDIAVECVLEWLNGLVPSIQSNRLDDGWQQEGDNA